MTQEMTNAELAKLAIEGYQPEEEELLNRDLETRRLYIAFNESARRDQDTALETNPDDLNALMPQPSAATKAAYDAYHDRLKQIAQS